MAEIRPIEFETGSLQMLQSLGEKRQREYLLEQKRMQEELEQKRELMNMVNPITLSKNLEAEVANASLTNLKGGVTSWLRQNPNASSGELQAQIQNELGALSQWNAKVKTIKDRIDTAIKDMPQDKTINRSALRSAAISRALYNPNTGTLKSADELDDQTDFVSEVWNSGGSRVINIGETDADLRKEIGAQPMSELDVMVTKVDPKSNRKTTIQQRTKAANYMQWDEKKNKFDIKRGADGLIDNSVYASFIGDTGSARDKMFEFRAEQEIKSGRAGMNPLDVFNEDGSLKDPAALDYTKKRLAGEFIIANSPITQANKDIQNTIYKISVNNQQASPVSEEFKPWHPFTIIEGIRSDRGGFRGDKTTVEGVEAYDVTSNFSSYKPEKIGSASYPYNRVYYSPSTDQFYTSVSTNGKLSPISGDQLGSRIAQSAPDINFDVKSKIWRTLPAAPAADKKPTSGKTISASEFRNMTLQQRSKFISSGGTVN
jgi:hypothetical protein